MVSKGKYTLFESKDFGEWLQLKEFNRKIKLVQNHHTYSPSYKVFDGNNHFEVLEMIEKDHVVNMGLGEIGQHFTTFPDGKIATGRSLDKIPAGIKSANQFGISIEHLGNFNAGNDIMTEEHKKAIVLCNAFLCEKFNIEVNTENIVYHSWYDSFSGTRTEGSENKVSCPGDNFFGGNGIEDAKNYFIPVIKEAIDSYDTKIFSSNGRVTAEIIADALNVRTYPGISGEIVKTLTKGVVVTIFEEGDGWYKIHPEQNHWIYSGYLKRFEIPHCE